MGRGTHDNPLTDDEYADWWIRVRRHHAAANAAWAAKVAERLRSSTRDHAKQIGQPGESGETGSLDLATQEYAGAYNLRAESLTGQNKEKTTKRATKRATKLPKKVTRARKRR